MKFTVIMVSDEKTLSRKFEFDDGQRVYLDADDEFIKDIVSKTLKDFGQSPQTIKVKCSLDL